MIGSVNTLIFRSRHLVHDCCSRLFEFALPLALDLVDSASAREVVGSIWNYVCMHVMITMQIMCE